ncbi:methyl-accepting chemotaxis protein [Marinomonas mediterranea]|uniref:methyl-accepting chemotaxis protein n=1 Tax=Marinomonas mediterranea TaxID=119864 RepID=UPI002348FDF2|nr:methyl-accepting chemotaxis protein [Marinomonas mediterranea]WCN09780.1 HAMP domain-containing protein [Marinomonas mediterranea]
MSKFKISNKLIMMTVMQIALLLVVGLFSIAQMAKIGSEIKEIAHDHLPLAETLTLVTEHQLQNAVAIEKVISHALLDKVKGKGISAESADLIAKLNKNMKKLHDEIVAAEQTIITLRAEVHSSEAKKEYEHVLVEYKKVENEYFEVERMVAVFLQHITDDGIESALDEIPAIEHANEALDEHLIAVLNEVQQFSINSVATAYQDEQKAVTIIIVALVVSIVLGVVVAYSVGLSITRPLKKLMARLEDLVSGEGDLTLRMNLDAKDELGDVANKLDLFMGKLHGIIVNVSKSSDSLNASSESAVGVIHNTLEGVERQKTETAVVASAIDQMSSATSEVARSTMEASDVANNVRELVSKGKTAAEENQKITSQLSKEVQDTSNSIDNLVKETDNIGAVLDTIQGIAEQTNLLALNAAIEAARAGESGRGFAVVADEVRSLAQRTQTSTVDIQNLVENLQKGAEDAMSRMNKGVEITQHCLEIGRETADHFDNAVHAVNEIADLNRQIAAAAEEQSTVAAQIQGNVENINTIAQDTSADAQQVAEANENIATNVVSLNSDLNQFKV